jgi:GntR family transcriptional regulator
MFFRTNPDSGQPLYVQLGQQIRHAVETGALRPGDGLPGIRTLAEQLVVSAATVAKAYSKLEQEGILEIRHGSGAFISATFRPPDRIQGARARVRAVIAKLREEGLTDQHIQRLFEAELLYRPETAVNQ